MNKVFRNISRVVNAALGEGIDNQVTHQGVAMVSTILPVVVPDGITPPSSLISGYSWVALNKARSR